MREVLIIILMTDLHDNGFVPAVPAGIIFLYVEMPMRFCDFVGCRQLCMVVTATVSVMISCSIWSVYISDHGTLRSML